MKLLVDNEKLLTEEIKLRAKNKEFRDERELVGGQYVELDRNRHYQFPYSSKHLHEGNFGKER